ncbi:MAG: beta-propeller domain-containing protein [Actinobacteria bacterium]|nr:beta-propeller domain-containing protein [Actinomycetota bacterium]
MRRFAAILLTFAFAAAACGSGTTDPGASGTTTLPDKNTVLTTTTSGGHGTTTVTTTLPGTTVTTTVPVTTVPGSTTVTSLPEVELGDLTFVSALVPFTACDDLLSYLRDEASARVGPYGLLGGGWYAGGPDMFIMEDMARGMSFAAESGVVTADSAGTASATTMAPATQTFDGGDENSMQEGVDFSGTNVQELGIDEPDLIKTDGTRIIIIEDQWLHLVDVSGDTAVLTDTIELPNHWGSELLLEGDRLLVLTQKGAYYEEGVTTDSAVSRLVAPGGWMSLTSLVEVDLSDPSDLQVVSTLTLEGSYVSARVVNGAARVVVTSGPEQMPFVYPQNEAGEKRATEFNRQIIAETVVADWLPSYVHEAADGTITDGLLVDCDRVSHPTEFAGFSALSVVTVDLTAPMGVPDATSVLADGQTIYAGGGNLYVATTSYVDPTRMDDESSWEEMERNYATSIHQFDVSDPAATVYVGSGSVPGHVLNQFSMSEHAGHLRVATTVGSPWSGTGSESMITVLAADSGGDLVQVGQVGEMGKGERIYSVRFVGDVGYVVTFRQTDPFYTIDLSDPTNPVVRGELKITGYSGYLHPISDDLVLGIGQEATEEGRTLGTKVTLFDVSDLDNPTALDTWAPGGGGSSSAEWDHRAFLWWAPLDLAVLPFQDWNTGEAAAVALRIADGTITEVGRIDHSPEDDEVAPLVEPPCPTVDPADLGAEEGDSFFGMSTETIVFMFCDDDGVYPQMKGFSCESLPTEEAVFYAEEFGIDDLTLPDGKMFTACWPQNYEWQRPIQRTLVIGEDLWSYSYGRLQSNALDGLARLDAINL